MVTSGRTHTEGIFQDCCRQCPCPHDEPLLTPTSVGDPATVVVGLVQSPVGSLLLSPGPWSTRDFVCALQQGSLCFPGPAGLHSQIPWGLSVPLSDPQAGKPDMGLRTFTKVVKLLLVLLFSSLWVTHPVDRGFNFIIIESLLPYRCSFFFSLDLR